MSREQFVGRIRSDHVARRAAGLLAGIGVGVIAAVAVGPVAIVRALAGANPGFVALAVAMVGIALIAWGCSLWKVLRSLGATVSVGRACGLFLGSVFLNKVTPFGQAGGDIPSGYLLASDCEMRTETGVAAITSVNTVNKVAGIGIGLVGLSMLDGVGSVGPGRAATVWGAVTVGLGAFAVTGWRYRWRIVSGLVAVLTPPVATLSERFPVGPSINRDDIESRLAGFVRAIERIGTGRTAAWVILLGTAGQLAVAVALWAVLGSLGVTVPVTAAAVTVPAARVAAITPTPGGVGVVEVTLGAVLIALTGISAVQAGTAALLYHIVAFWLPMLPGAVVVGSLLLAPGR